MTVELLVGVSVLGLTAAAIWMMRRRPAAVRSEMRHVSLTEEDLLRFPEDERTLFAQLSYLHSSINVLRRWIIASRSDQMDRKPQLHAAIAQQQLAGRFLAGVLYEGELLLRQSLFGTDVSQRYAAQLTDEAIRSQRSIKAYFRKENAFKAVRDKFAFHFDREEVGARLSALPKGSRFPLYISSEQGNSLYYLGEEVVGLAMLQTVGKVAGVDSPVDALRAFQKDLLAVSGDFDVLVAEYLRLMMQGNLPAEVLAAAERVDLGQVPPIDEIETPYFVGRPRA